MHDKPIRVLHMIASLNIGGSQMMLMNLYRKIDRTKVQFDFIIDHADEVGFKKEIEELGGRVYVLPTFRGRNIHEIKRAWNGFFKEHSEYKIIHTHSRSYASIYLPIAKKHGLITISHAHSTSNGKGISAFIKDLMQYPIRDQSDYMFACSQEAGRWLFGEKALQSDRFRVIPNAIDVKKFKYDAERRKMIRSGLGIKDEFVVGHVGRMMPPKNHDFLLRCFAEYQKMEPNSRLLLIGDGDLKKQLEDEAKSLGIIGKTIFLGALTNTDDYLQAMDCFVFPSLWEGLGIAVVEAEAAGLPCVVSDTVPRIVDVGAGNVVFKSLDCSPTEWANTIYSIDRKDISLFIKRAGYDVSENAFKLQEFYEEIGNEKKVYQT